MSTAMEFQALVTVGTYGGFFAAVSGGASQNPAVEEYNGGSLDPEILVGRTTYTDMTITKNFDPAADTVKLKFVAAVKKSGTTIPVTVQYTDGNLIPIPNAVLTYQGKITEVTPAAVDSGSQAAMKMSFVFKPSRLS